MFKLGLNIFLPFLIQQINLFFMNSLKNLIHFFVGFEVEHRPPLEFEVEHRTPLEFEVEHRPPTRV